MTGLNLTNAPQCLYSFIGLKICDLTFANCHIFAISVILQAFYAAV